MLWLPCSELLSPHDQLLCGLQSIGVQGDGTYSAFGLALLQMNLGGHEVNTLHLKIAGLDAAHPGFVLQNRGVISHGPLRFRFRRVNEPYLFLWRKAAASLGYWLWQRLILAVQFPLVVVLQDRTLSCPSMLTVRGPTPSAMRFCWYARISRVSRSCSASTARNLLVAHWGPRPSEGLVGSRVLEQRCDS